MTLRYQKARSKFHSAVMSALKGRLSATVQTIDPCRKLLCCSILLFTTLGVVLWLQSWAVCNAFQTSSTPALKACRTKMSESQSLQRRKKVSIRVEGRLYDQFKDKVAAQTQNKHGMSDVFEELIKAYTKSDIPEQVAQEGTPSQEDIDEDEDATTAQTEAVGDTDVNSHYEVIGTDTEIQFGPLPYEKVQLNLNSLILYNWYRVKYKLDADISNWVNASLDELWVAKGMKPRLALNKLGKGVMQTGK